MILVRKSSPAATLPGCATIEGVASPNLPDAALDAQAFTDSKFGSQAVLRLRAAFERSRHPMLIADDQRRWVTGNAAACDLLGIAREEVPWHKMDDFTPPSERGRLEEQWEAFLANGAAEGWYRLYVPDRGAMPLEFSAIANVLPARHLSVFIPPDKASTEEADGVLAREVAWTPVVAERSGRLELTEREREVMTLVASGLRPAIWPSACSWLPRRSSLTFRTPWASSARTRAPMPWRSR